MYTFLLTIQTCLCSLYQSWVEWNVSYYAKLVYYTIYSHHRFQIKEQILKYWKAMKHNIWNRFSSFVAVIPLVAIINIPVHKDIAHICKCKHRWLFLENKSFGCSPYFNADQCNSNQENTFMLYSLWIQLIMGVHFFWTNQI